jgi:hypothetical protein
MTEALLEKIILLLRFEIQISEGTLPKSYRESPETKGNKEGLIRKLGHLFKRTMLMKGKR